MQNHEQARGYQRPVRTASFTAPPPLLPQNYGASYPPRLNKKTAGLTGPIGRLQRRNPRGHSTISTPHPFPHRNCTASPHQFNDKILTQPAINTSLQPATSLTRVSSDEESQSRYKAYAPAIAPAPDYVSLSQRPVPSLSSIPGMPSSKGNSKDQDEIFFGIHGPAKSGRSNTPGSSDLPVKVPAPLNFTSNRSASTTAPIKQYTSHTLINLLPNKLTPNENIDSIENTRTKLEKMTTRQRSWCGENVARRVWMACCYEICS